MQPAVFDDGQLLAKTHYHVDACLWKAETFIDGATFLVPSRLPEAGSESYSVDLDESTGIYHVILRKLSLRRSLAVMKVSQLDYASHVVEFANGEMRAVPRNDRAATSPEREVQKVPYRDHHWSISIAQPEPIDHQCVNIQPSLAGSSVSIPLEPNLQGTISAPAGSDSSIAGFGRIVGRQAVDDQSSLCNFSISIHHIVPQDARAYTCIKTEGAAEAQKPIADVADIQTFDNTCASRRSSTGSHDSGISTSTVPTSPASSAFSTVPFEKLELADLSKVPIAPGKRTYMIKALALDELDNVDSEKTDDPDKTVLRRLSWDLSISDRQLKHWDNIHDSESPYPEEIPTQKHGLAMTEDGRIVLAEITCNNAQFFSSLPQLASQAVDACSPDKVDTSKSSQYSNSPDVLPLELANQPGMPSLHLDSNHDLNGKQTTTECMIGNEHAFQLFEEKGDDVAANQCSGNSNIVPKDSKTRDCAKSFTSPNLGKMIEEFFGDEEDEFHSTTSIVHNSLVPPVVSIPPVSIITQRLKGTTASVPMQLGSSIPVDAINAINTEFSRLWNEGVSGRCWIPCQDEDEVQKLAVANIAPLYVGLPDDIVLVANDFNKIVAELWKQGHPRRALVPGSTDDQLVYELAARNLEWEYFKTHLKNNLNRSTASNLTVKPQKTLEAAPSSFEWYLQALGGDD